MGGQDHDSFFSNIMLIDNQIPIAFDQGLHLKQ